MQPLSNQMMRWVGEPSVYGKTWSSYWLFWLEIRAVIGGHAWQTAWGSSCNNYPASRPTAWMGLSSIEYIWQAEGTRFSLWHFYTDFGKNLGELLTLSVNIELVSPVVLEGSVCALQEVEESCVLKLWKAQRVPSSCWFHTRWDSWCWFCCMTGLHKKKKLATSWTSDFQPFSMDVTLTRCYLI